MPPKKPVVLPSKERTLFARLIQEYESKKHKLGLKTADQILKKFPEHGETLCMKGLLMASEGHVAEGIAIAKRGVLFDLSSFICWHALGILHRMDKNYPEAIKCYSQALRIEKGNFNIQRESAYLYMQERNFAPCIEHRLELLKMQPHVRFNWISLVVAHHAAGSLDEALRILEGYEDVMRDVPLNSYEHSEIILYHASFLEETSRFDDAIKYLESQKSQHILDKKAADAILANCFLNTGNKSAAQQKYEILLKQNGNERSFINGWLRSKGIDVDNSTGHSNSESSAIFKELLEKFPNLASVKRLELAYLSGEEFSTKITEYIQTALQKGIPSLFNDLRSLYPDEAKLSIIQQVTENFRVEWTSNNGTSEQAEPPSSYLWALYYLAQHYSYLNLTQRALTYINSAIAHSPTLPEFHFTRARILKRGGDLFGASHAMEDARLLDGQDRFVNSKDAKYKLRIDQIEDASRVAGLFTKPDALSPAADLNEMQALWYLVEEADAWARRGNLNMALKRLHQADAIFTEMHNDQLDFHSYCTRKFTLRAYMNVIRWEDQLRSHPTYFRVALAAIRIYLRLYDNPQLARPGDAKVVNGDLNEEEKKEAKKAKRAELKAAEEAKKNQPKPKPEPKKADDNELPPLPKDEDPDGIKLLQTEIPLENAQTFLRSLIEHADKKIETWLAAFEIAIRGNNILLASRALVSSHALEPSHPELHVQIIRFRKIVDSLESPPPQVTAAIDAALGIVAPGDISLEALHAEYVQRHGSSACNLLGAAKGLVEIRSSANDVAAKQDATSLILQLPHSDLHPRLESLVEAQQFLTQRLKPDSKVLDEFRHAAHSLFPLANAFASQEALQEQAQKRDSDRARWTPVTDELNGTPLPA